MARELKKGGQLTMFIIVAILIVAAIVLLSLLLMKKNPEISKPSVTEPEQYIQKCTRDSARQAVDILLRQGGTIDPKNYKLYKDEKVSYLCYTSLFYSPCQMQEPLFVKHIEEEITEYTRPAIDECFDNLKRELEERGYPASLGRLKTSTELSEGIVRISIERNIDIEKQGETRRYSDFKAVFNSPIYELAILAQEIASQEAKYCHSMYDGIMLLYPKFGIEKFSVGSGENTTKVYLIEEIYSKKKLNIAVRSCALPAGF